MFENKIRTIEELAEIIQKAKKTGKKVALSHGCFDLLHIGHIKHLNAAKKMADVLVVTVTPDRFIYKGPSKPVFNESLRLEALANFGMIDYVGLNDSPDAVSLIKRLKPNFYVKGDEYKNFKGHPEGKRIKEKEAVESCGGEMVFTSELTFSSTALINKNFDFLPPNVNSFLQEIRNKYSQEQFQNFLKEVSELEIIVVGDPIIDEYVYCKTVGTITKFPAISAIYTGMIKMAGGGMAIARHIAEFVKKVDYVGIAGDKDNEISFMEEKLKEKNIIPHLVLVPGRFSTVKRRFVSGNYPTTLELQMSTSADDKLYKLFEIAFIDNSLINEDTERKICSILEEIINDKKMVVLADFGHGMITSKIAELIAKKSKWWSLNAQTNSTNYGFNLVTKYKKPSFVCLDEMEARLPFGDRYRKREEILEELSRAISCQDIMMSMGKEGLILKADHLYHAPALAFKTVDTVGSGDAVLSMASLCRYLNLEPLPTVFLSAAMGALVTQIICNTEPVRKRKFIQFVEGVLKS